ncbi:MAG: hypothetical protein Ct9H300mP11_06510 [Chloroflexota bacterium]|nr:MAG: hypothetical protein Ct9H300mP11_06510 [Chloroflexota bacterium]
MIHEGQVLASKGMVATNQPLAPQLVSYIDGRWKLLMRIATAAALNVVEPMSTGLAATCSPGWDKKPKPFAP